MMSYLTEPEESERKSRPQKSKILAFWFSSNIEAEFPAIYLDEGICFACGRESENLERCHIIPKALGGSNDASNFLLLCKWCHEDAPDIACRDIVLSWVSNHPHFILETVEMIYKEIEAYGFSRDILRKHDDIDDIKEVINDYSGIVSTHGPKIVPATIAAVFILKEIAGIIRDLATSACCPWLFFCPEIPTFWKKLVS